MCFFATYFAFVSVTHINGWSVQSQDGSVGISLDTSACLVAVTVNQTSGFARTQLTSSSGISLLFEGQRVPVRDNDMTVVKLPDGGVSFSRQIRLGNNTAIVAETFSPEPNAIGWSLTINGTTPDLWSPSILVNLTTVSAPSSLWLPWSAPQCSPNAIDSAQCQGLLSPMQSLPSNFVDAESSYHYGCAGAKQPLLGQHISQGSKCVSVPLAAMLDNASDTAFSLSVAPTPNLIQVTGLSMTLSPVTMAVGFGPGYRVSSSTRVLNLKFHITGSQACTRAVLQKYVARHDEYFSPPNTNVHYRASGMGSYAATQGPVDQVVDGMDLNQTIARTGYAVNWDATFWWPYIMMIAPTISTASNYTDLWGSFYDKQSGYNNRLSTVHVHASYAIRQAYYNKWRQDANVTVLGYFNGWELGQNMADYPPTNCPPPSDLWRSAPCFIHAHLDAALCTNAEGHRDVGHGARGWDGDTMLDPAHPSYASFLQRMVQNHLDMEPSFMGLASDGIRACTNYAGDDGVSCGGPTCRPLSDGFTAWASLMDTIGPMLHDRDLLFSCNTINGPRIHLMRHADLFITEQTASEYALASLNAFLGLRKPGVMWTTSLTDKPDRFFQRLLHLGLFPMLPMPDADHSIRNGSMTVHQLYLDYGECFKMLKGREWVLRPHAIELQEISSTKSTFVGAGIRTTAWWLADLAPCSDSDLSQRWSNSSAPPGMLASVGAIGRCLEVQNDAFTPQRCGDGTDGSRIIMYPCEHVGAWGAEVGVEACPHDANIVWKLTGKLLRSGVPAGDPGPNAWDTCLAARGTRLALERCNNSDSAQQFSARAIASHPKQMQIVHGDANLCLSASNPPPPPPPTPVLPPIANLFRDQQGCEIVVITSPGTPSSNITTASVVVRGSSFNRAVKAEAVWPGAQAPTPLSSVEHRDNGDIVLHVILKRGMAMIRLYEI